MVGDVSLLARAEASGMKAGIRAGLQTFLKNLLKKHKDDR
jgi:hypothetical protein